MREASRLLWQKVPPFPAGLSASEMADRFDKWCRLVAAAVAPATRDAPRQPWITPGTWALIKQRRASRQVILAQTAQLRLARMRVVFQALAVRPAAGWGLAEIDWFVHEASFLRAAAEVRFAALSLLATGYQG